jgi:LCP family protein required for cell wall assembly
MFGNLSPITVSRRSKGQLFMTERRIRLLLVLGLLVATGAICGAYLFNLANTFNTQSKKISDAFPAEITRPSKPPESGGGPSAINLLLIATDSNSSVKPANASGNGQGNGQGNGPKESADAVMLVHLPADRKTASVVSIARDTEVDVPGFGRGVIGNALSLGGPPLVVQTVESLLGTRVDHMAMIDFQGLSGLTDALGGVTVNVDKPFTPQNLVDHSFTAGANAMNGQQALAFVRERNAFTAGENQRVRNQQEFLKSVLNKILTLPALATPAAVNDVVTKFSPFVGVDSGLDAIGMAGLLSQFQGLNAKSFTFLTLPVTRPAGSPATPALPVVTEVAKLAKALQADKMSEYVQH